jgi:hypothetical protein
LLIQVASSNIPISVPPNTFLFSLLVDIVHPLDEVGPAVVVSGCGLVVLASIVLALVVPATVVVVVVVVGSSVVVVGRVVVVVARVVVVVVVASTVVVPSVVVVVIQDTRTNKSKFALLSVSDTSLLYIQHSFLTLLNSYALQAVMSLARHSFSQSFTVDETVDLVAPKLFVPS